AAGAGYYLSQRILYMRKKDEQLIYEREVKAKRLHPAAYHELPKEEVWVTSPLGYRIKTLFVRPNPGKKYVIFSHGVTENKMNSIKYMNLFLKYGFNAVLYDHARHGESEGTKTSYGYYEKYDLQAVVNELIKQEGEEVIFGIHGESMGAATLLLYAGTLEDRADFYVADCPFSDFRRQVEHQMKREIKIVPKWLVHLAEWAVILRGKFRLSEISPLEAVRHIQKPVLFIHSEQDDFILPDMTQELYEQKPGPKQLFLAKKGTHAQSYNENPLEYEKAVEQFLLSHGLIKASS
ncbi:MAG TPA: alpha/beta hydrolase, partial [Chondromyces sp.]|nr:alpha/beta hydrolase [Chondromyces sp.]